MSYVRENAINEIDKETFKRVVENEKEKIKKDIITEINKLNDEEKEEIMGTIKCTVDNTIIYLQKKYLSNANYFKKFPTL